MSLDLALLWLLCRLAATAPFRPLAWEPPLMPRVPVSVALIRQKIKQKIKRKKEITGVSEREARKQEKIIKDIIFLNVPKLKNVSLGFPAVEQWDRRHFWSTGAAGSIPDLAQWVKELALLQLRSQLWLGPDSRPGSLYVAGQPKKKKYIYLSLKNERVHQVHITTNTKNKNKTLDDVQRWPQPLPSR